MFLHFVEEFGNQTSICGVVFICLLILDHNSGPENFSEENSNSEILNLEYL